MSKENSTVPFAATRKKNNRQLVNQSGNRQQSKSKNSNDGSSTYNSVVIGKSILPSNRVQTKDVSSGQDIIYNSKQHDKLGDIPNSDAMNQIDVSRLSENLTKMLLQNETHCFTKRGFEIKSVDNATSLENSSNSIAKGKKPSSLLDEVQTQQIKKVLVDCLQNNDRNWDENAKEKYEPKFFCRKSFGKIDKHPNNGTDAPKLSSKETTKTSLLRSYLSGSNPTREEYISKRGNVSNSLISSDSVHHSILLESSRERRQCLLQYLSNVVGDGQVVIYVNSIPGAEALMSFLKKHGFQVNAVHPRLLLAESNWILSEFSLKKFDVLLCAEDHYHSCPAHFRWVKTIINYELPICNPTENWSIRNGIVEFSDNLPVHIYTFIKKSCPLDHELIKLLRLDSQAEDQEIR